MIFIFSVIVGFTVFCQFSTVQQSDPVTHTRTCTHTHTPYSFSYIILRHVPSKWLDIVPSAIQQDVIFEEIILDLNDAINLQDCIYLGIITEYLDEGPFLGRVTRKGR